MTETSKGAYDLSVLPLRFTDNVAQMRDFFVLLGLSPRVSRDLMWIDMVGAAGMVALHDAATSDVKAPSGRTSLGISTTNADAVAARLKAAGIIDVTIYDEAYGRTLLVRYDGDAELWINEDSDDHYGYDVDDPQPQNGIVSMPIRFGAPAGSFADLLSAIGFGRLDEGDDQYWRVWSAERGGMVALHPATEVMSTDTVRLGFRTQEPLAQLADRLRAAGHTDVVVTDDFGGELTVTDPDGQHVLVQPLPGAAE